MQQERDGIAALWSNGARLDLDSCRCRDTPHCGPTMPAAVALSRRFASLVGSIRCAVCNSQVRRTVEARRISCITWQELLVRAGSVDVSGALCLNQHVLCAQHGTASCCFLHITSADKLYVGKKFESANLLMVAALFGGGTVVCWPGSVTASSDPSSGADLLCPIATTVENSGCNSQQCADV
jgi:hypothetical protein